MESTFENCVSLKSISLSGFTTYKVKSMNKLFKSTRLTSIDLNIFNASNVVNMSFMFANSNSLESVNMANFETNNVEDMSYFFYSCKSLTSVSLINLKSLKFGQFKIGDGNLQGTFKQCTSLISVDVSGFSTKYVTNMPEMF